MTKIVRLKKPNKVVLKEIAGDLKKGKTVVFPTETVYGLGANAFDAKAVKKIFKAKERPMDNPLIVHLAFKKDLKKLVLEISPMAQKLISRFWPGSLTLLFFKSKKVPRIVTAGLSTVAIRMPSHPIARALIQEAKIPIAAPSANIAGKPSSTRASHAFEDLLGKVDWIIDSGSVQTGLESTILDSTQFPPVLLRPGAVSKEQIEKVIGKIIVHATISKSRSKKIVALAPGMKYRHYAPNAIVWLVASKKLLELARHEHKKRKIAVFTLQKKSFSGCKVFYFASLKKMAKELFHSFRVCDQKGIQLILVESVSEKGIGLAIKNRLKKAATREIK
ncbi:threonylcarbamoyl-AMP synthase [Candidatus Micrarchaeota archaeon]|nr:threonylcarbamoyl-AMP synthase [Candidatus Micrarchaeota archaeon]MBU1930154.1 threonylcarbamoyl-AMP synthase [Candidatus Micrarchaeota archaeon]